MSRTRTHIKSCRNVTDRIHSDNFEYSDMFKQAYRDEHKRHGWTVEDPPTGYDISYTTCASNYEQVPKRHPYKKKHHSLNREFATIGGRIKIGDIRDPYGPVYDRSFRMKGVRKVGARIRRSRLKEQTNQEIAIQLSYTNY